MKAWTSTDETVEVHPGERVYLLCNRGDCYEFVMQDSLTGQEAERWIANRDDVNGGISYFVVRAADIKWYCDTHDMR